MTNEQILKKAIEKAIKSKRGIGSWMVFIMDDWKNYTPLTRSYIYYPIIFSHDFAKAFWGEEEWCHECDKPLDNCSGKGCMSQWSPKWKYCQHRMLDYVQEGKEPLKYLEKFLEGE